MMTRRRLRIASRHSGITCHSWTLLKGQPPFFFSPLSPSGSIKPARINRRGHFASDTAESVDEDDTDSVSPSLSFFLFLPWEPSDCRRARLLAECFSFFEDAMPKDRMLDIGRSVRLRAWPQLWSIREMLIKSLYCGSRREDTTKTRMTKPLHQIDGLVKRV